MMRILPSIGARPRSLAQLVLVLAASSCGEQPAAVSPARSPEPAALVGGGSCGDAEQVHAHDLSAERATEAATPCASAGPRDYSAIVKMETLDQGVHITIDATDDEVTLLGPDVKERDSVVVYPRGKGSPGVEVGLVKTKVGYRGDKIVFWDDLGALTDDGSRIDVAIYDHDRSAGSTEEMHLSLAVSTGKSCEKAQDENMQTIDMRSRLGAKADLTKEQLGAPMRTSSFFARCGLPDSSNADVCVAVKHGKPIGVSVTVTPANKRVAACIDRSTRRLAFPDSDNLDVIHQKF
ncbi:MAG TPA: hypothetical protein VE987_14295, partial [Polyangiaceae bacterium]|nr:hypothetical protein [Polyangiaceae bacterium]